MGSGFDLAVSGVGFAENDLIAMMYSVVKIAAVEIGPGEYWGRFQVLVSMLEEFVKVHVYC